MQAFVNRWSENLKLQNYCMLQCIKRSAFFLETFFFIFCITPCHSWCGTASKMFHKVTFFLPLRDENFTVNRITAHCCKYFWNDVAGTMKDCLSKFVSKEQKYMSYKKAQWGYFSLLSWAEFHPNRICLGRTPLYLAQLLHSAKGFFFGHDF